MATHEHVVTAFLLRGRIDDFLTAAHTKSDKITQSSTEQHKKSPYLDDDDPAYQMILQRQLLLSEIEFLEKSQRTRADTIKLNDLINIFRNLDTRNLDTRNLDTKNKKNIDADLARAIGLSLQENPRDENPRDENPRNENPRGQNSSNQTPYSGLNNDGNYCFANALFQSLASLQFMSDPLTIISNPNDRPKRHFFDMIHALAKKKPIPANLLSLTHLYEEISNAIRACEQTDPLRYKNVELQAATLCPFPGQRVLQQDAGELWNMLNVFFNLNHFEFQVKTKQFCLARNAFISSFQENPDIVAHSTLYTGIPFLEQEFFTEKAAFQSSSRFDENDIMVCPGWNPAKSGATNKTRRSTVLSEPDPVTKLRRIIGYKEEKIVGPDENVNHQVYYNFQIPQTNKCIYFFMQRIDFNAKTLRQTKNNTSFLFLDSFEKHGIHYELKAVTCQTGYVNSGHYTAFCKRDSTWYFFNDSRVTPVSTFSDVLKGARKTCTQLFYERV
jgi:hypothetical protein